MNYTEKLPSFACNQEEEESNRHREVGRVVIPVRETKSAGDPVFLRIQKLSETGIFLEESEVFVIARVIAVFRTQLNGDLEIGHGGIGFAR